MLVGELMSRQIVCCTPSDTAQTAAWLMKMQGVGAIPVVLDQADALLEGIITDRDLSCGIVASGRKASAVKIAELMTRVPVTCEPGDTMQFCEKLMQENQVRRIPVVDERGRCIGIVSQADVALHSPAMEVVTTLAEISKPSNTAAPMHSQGDFFYCGQPHEMDEILLLNRRRELHKHA